MASYVYDNELDFFDEVRDAIKCEVPNALITNTYVDAPYKFPCIYIELKNRWSADSDLGANELAQRVDYVVEIYSNKPTNAKDECKRIADIVKREFVNRAFTETFYDFLPNIDLGIRRLVLKYYAVKNK